MSDRSLPIDTVKAQSRSNMSDRQKVELLRAKLADCMQWLSAYAQGNGSRSALQRSERYKTYKDALTATDK